MSEELRPCPFCGGKAVTSTFFDWDDLEYMAIEVNDSESIYGEVTCENERCINGWYLPPEAWNTRPIEDALNARVAELEAELRDRKAASKSLWFDAANAQARVNELEAERRWIPVSERLPDTKIVYDEFDVIVELVDIVNGEKIRHVDLLSYDYRNESWNDDCGEFGFYQVTGVTHWRERPIPPEVQE